MKSSPVVTFESKEGLNVRSSSQAESLLAAEKRALEMMANGSSLSEVLNDLCSSIARSGASAWLLVRRHGVQRIRITDSMLRHFESLRRYRSCRRHICDVDSNCELPVF